MRSRLRMTVGRRRVHAELVRRGTTRWQAEAGHEGPEDLAQVIAQLGAEPELRGTRRLEVRLETPVVQLRTLTDLPPVRSAMLSAIVANQAPRFFRKNGKPLVTAAVWLRRERGTARQAQAAAVELPWLEAIDAGARAAGLVLESVRPEGAAATIRLSVPGAEGAGGWLLRLPLRWLVFLNVLLWGGTFGLYASRLHHERAAIDAELRSLAAPLAAVHDVRHELDEAAAMVDAVERDAAARGAAVTRLQRIAAALPDSSYLTSVTLDAAGSGTMTGYARRAARVVAALERARAVSAPRLEGPALEEVAAGREWERFTIAFGRGAR